MVDFAEAGLRRVVALSPDEAQENLDYETSPVVRGEFLNAIRAERDPAKRAVLEDAYLQDFGEQPTGGGMTRASLSSLSDGQPGIERARRATLSDLTVYGSSSVADVTKAEPQRPGGMSGRLKDTAVDLASGVVALGESVVGLGDLATFGLAGKALESIGYDPKRTKEWLAGFYSDPRQQEERDIQQADGFWDTLTAIGARPGALVGRIAQSIPGTVGAGAVGGVVARRLAATAATEAKAAGLAGAEAELFISERIAEQAGKVMAAASGAEGAQAAGSIAEAGRQAGSDWTRYAPAAAAAGAGTAAIGLGSAKLAGRLGIGDIETDIALRGAGSRAGQSSLGLVKRVPVEAAKEGALEEMPQSAQEKVAENIATRRPWDERVGAAAAEGLAAGAGMGGGHALLSGRAPAQPTGETIGGKPLADIPTETLFSLSTSRVVSDAAREKINAELDSRWNADHPSDGSDGGSGGSGFAEGAPGTPESTDTLADQMSAQNARRQELIDAQGFAEQQAEHARRNQAVIDATPEIGRNIPASRLLPAPSQPDFIASTDGVGTPGQWQNAGLAGRVNERLFATARGLLNHSPRPSPDLLARLMRVDGTMAAQLFGRWQSSNGGANGNVAGSSNAQVPAQGDPGSGDFPAGGAAVARPLPGGQPSAADSAAAVPAPGGAADVALGTARAAAVTPIDLEAHAATTSPFNATPQPTEAQKESGNYRKGHVRLHGLDISIENPSGSVRTGMDATGRPWQQEMRHHYGYIRGTVGKDKDHLDVFLGPQAETADTAYVIDQIDPKTWKFDEHKIVLGAGSEDDARAIYQSNYEPGWQGLGAITAMPMAEFKAWIAGGETRKPLAYVQPKKTPVDDWRIQDGGYRQAIESMAADFGWAETGGKLLRDAVTGEVIGRTNWIPRSNLWPGRPAGVSEAEARQFVRDALDGKAMPAKGKRFIGYLLDYHDMELNLEREAERLAEAARNAYYALVAEAKAILGDDEVAGELERLAVQFEDDEGGYFAAATAYLEGVRNEAEQAKQGNAGEAEQAVAGKPGGGDPSGRAEDGARHDEAEIRPADPGILQAHSRQDLAAKSAREADESIEGRATADREREHFSLAPQSQEKTEGPTQQGGLFTPDGRASAQATATIAGKPVSEMSAGMIEQIARSSQPAAEKANAELQRRAQQNQEQRGTIRRILPDGRLEVKTQNDGYMVVAESEIVHKPEGGNQGGKPVATEFIKAPDGSIDFGEITEEQAQAMRRQAGKIRLTRGEHNKDGTGYGLAHIEANHGKQIRNAGFESVEAFVSHVATKFDEILQGSGRQLLVAVDGERQDVMFVQLEPDETGDFYRINTAFPASRDYLDKQQRKGMKLLWGGSEPASPVAGQQALYAGNPEGDSGQAAPIAQGQSSEGTIPPDAQPDNRIDDFGEKIGGARKDTARPLGTRGNAVVEESAEPGWRKRFSVAQIAASSKEGEVGQWVIRDERKQDWRGQPRQVGQAFATKEAAEKAIPLLAVALKHHVVPVRVEMTEAQVDAMVARDAAAAQADRDRPGRMEYMVMERARGELASGRITREQYESVFKKYDEAARQYTPPAAAKPEQSQAYEIWRYVTDRKRVKVVDQQFATRDDAMRYMAEHAAEIIETKTGFGEEILAKPDIVQRTGAARRTGPATAAMFTEAFGFRAVEFGLWNNQDERQEVMNHAYDGLLDLADVLNVPARALSLNGDLALAFGARGQGLSGAKAHYETDYGVINLTKMTGAGSLAHEWFHALDHYLARQDTKAKSEKVRNSRGDLVYPTSTDRMDMASHGFSLSKSQVRPELQAAYDSLIQTMFTKAEQYVEDTQKAEKFVGDARKRLAEAIKEIRANLTRGPEQLTHMARNNKPASAEQLATFDQLADKLIAGQDLDTDFVYTSPANMPAGKRRAMSGRWSNDTLEGMSAILKAVRGRQGFNAERTGPLDGLRYLMKNYGERIKMLESASANETKTKRVPTSYAMENKKIDQGRASDYWTTPHEMAARAFSAYVEDKVGEQGNRSDFLAYGANNNLPQYRMLNVRPFPEGAERVAINQAFDALVGEIKTRETDKGVAVFSIAPERNDAVPAVVMDDVAAQQIIDGFRAKFRGANKMVAVTGFAALPANVQQDARDQGGEEKNTKGAFDHRTGTIYIVAGNHTSAADIEETVFHEALGHLGVRTLLGKGFVDELNSLFDAFGGLEGLAKIAKDRGFSKEFAAYVKGVAKARKKNPIAFTTMIAKAVLAEEVFAHSAQHNPKLLDRIKALVGQLREFLRAHGLAKLADYGETDLLWMLQKAEVKLRTGQADGKGGWTVFMTAYHGSRTDDDLQFAADVLQELAVEDELFRYPVSGSTSLEGVFADVYPGGEYAGEITRADEQNESSADHIFMFKNQEGKPFYVFARDSGEVWIDVSRFEEGEGGSAVYAAVANWAYNTRRKFIGDPKGLSEAAVVRRTPAMLASALRFGTMRHLEAAPEQIQGYPEHGIAPLNWWGDDQSIPIQV